MIKKSCRFLLFAGLLLLVSGCSKIDSTNTEPIITTLTTQTTTLSTEISSNRIVQISFFLYEGEEIFSDFSEEGTIFSLPQPSRNGYTFLGWQFEESYEQPGFYSLEVPSNDLNLFAKWEINQYTLTFETNGGENYEPQIYDFNEAINPPIDPFKEGYKLEGWYIDPELSEKFVFTTMPAENITIYANWITNFQYLFSYFSENGTFYSNELIDGYIITIPDTENTYKFSVEADGTIYLSCIYENETGGYIFELSYKYEEFSPFAIVLSISAYTLNVYGTDDDATYDFETSEFIYEYDFNTWGVIIPEESIIEVTESSFNQLLLFSISYFETIIGVPFQ
jgi:uncharacterized repeat protein (TIGR02543 family)